MQRSVEGIIIKYDDTVLKVIKLRWPYDISRTSQLSKPNGHKSGHNSNYFGKESGVSN